MQPIRLASCADGASLGSILIHRTAEITVVNPRSAPRTPMRYYYTILAQSLVVALVFFITNIRNSEIDTIGNFIKGFSKFAPTKYTLAFCILIALFAFLNPELAPAIEKNKSVLFFPIVMGVFVWMNTEFDLLSRLILIAPLIGIYVFSADKELSNDKDLYPLYRPIREIAIESALVLWRGRLSNGLSTINISNSVGEVVEIEFHNDYHSIDQKISFGRFYINPGHTNATIRCSSEGTEEAITVCHSAKPLSGKFYWPPACKGTCGRNYSISF
jgi:hypothetical protein